MEAPTKGPGLEWLPWVRHSATVELQGQCSGQGCPVQGPARNYRAKMSQSPFIPFYTSDFLGGTGGMTAATKGVYITLLCLIYEADGPIAQRWDMLARRCGCTLPAFKRAVSDLVDDAKIEIVDGAIWSSKCGEHIAQRRERQSSAKAAAEKRWKKTKQKQGKVDAGALPAQCKPEPEIEDKSIPPLTPPQGEKPKRRKPAKPLDDNWVPDLDRASRLMEEHDLTRPEMNFCYQQMKGHAHATDRRQADWNAAFANWVRKSVRDGEIGPNSRSRKAERTTAFDFE